MTSKKVVVTHFNVSWFLKLWYAYQSWYANNCIPVCVLNKKLKYEKNKNLKNKQNISLIYLLIRSIADVT